MTRRTPSVDRSRVRTQPARRRASKVKTAHEARPLAPGAGVGELLESLPNLLGAADLNAAIDASSATRKPERGEQIFLMPPEMADIVVNEGWDLTRVQDFLQNARHPYPFEGVRDLDTRTLARSPDDIHPIITGGVGIKSVTTNSYVSCTGGVG